MLVLAGALLGTCIYIKAPIEHTNRPFTAEEKVLFRKRSIQLYLGWSIAAFASWIGRLKHVSVGFACVFLIIAIYMVVERRNEKGEKESA